MNKGKQLNQEAHQLRAQAVEQLRLGNNGEAARLFGEASDKFQEASFAYGARIPIILRNASIAFGILTILYAVAMIIVHLVL